MTKRKSSWLRQRLFPLAALFALSFGLLIFTLSFQRADLSMILFEREASGLGAWQYQGWAIPNFAYYFNPRDIQATFEGRKLTIPVSVSVSLNKEPNTKVLGEVSGQERWIEVDLSDQKIIAWEGDRVFLESAVSSGLPGTPTPTGEFKVWYKTKSQKMSGGEGRSYYYLPNVPYIMFFENDNVSGFRGYSLHGTYWHNDFGNRRSHGCVNLPIPIAEQLYYWTQPNLSEGQRIVRATSDNPGTRIVIHE